MSGDRSNRDIATMAVDIAKLGSSMISEGNPWWIYSYEDEQMAITYHSGPVDPTLKVEWSEDLMRLETVFLARRRPFTLLVRKPGDWVDFLVSLFDVVQHQKASDERIRLQEIYYAQLDTARELERNREFAVF